MLALSGLRASQHRCNRSQARVHPGESSLPWLADRFFIRIHNGRLPPPLSRQTANARQRCQHCPQSQHRSQTAASNPHSSSHTSEGPHPLSLRNLDAPRVHQSHHRPKCSHSRSDGSTHHPLRPSFPHSYATPEPVIAGHRGTATSSSGPHFIRSHSTLAPTVLHVVM